MKLLMPHALGVTLLGGLLGSVGCATEISDGTGGFSSGETTAATTASVSVSSSAMSTTGGGPCAQNCSEITVPDCFESVCNTQTGVCELQALEDGEPCEDGLFCTDGDTCQNAACEPGPPLDCDPGNDPCLIEMCDEDLDVCSGMPKPNGSTCTSPDPCMVGSICQNGTCLGAPKDCSATVVPDECHVGMCDPMQNGLCVPVIGNDGQLCTTFGDPCMVQKTCNAGACEGGIPKDCGAFTSGCNNGLCEPTTGACYADPVPPGGTCLEATDDCNLGTCDSMGQCIGAPANEGGVCNDGSSCTINDVCGGGTCAGVPDPNYTIYFTETFVSNAQGWTLGPNWQIGSAQASSGQNYGNPDPATDHTPSADNGVAGVVLGGNAPTSMLHPHYYLTSPVIDTSGVVGSLWLEYWRWLNSDYASFMVNIIEVYDGATWQTVWVTGSSPGVQDAAWFKHSLDVTAYKNANFQMRWGYTIGSSGVYTVSSWNVDDVSLASAPCN